MSEKSDVRRVTPRALDFLSILDWLILPKDPALRGHLQTMRRRLLLNMAREARAGMHMTFDAMRADITMLTKVDTSFDAHFIWAEGFFGAIGHYVRFAKDARERGIQVICPYAGQRNTFPWRESHARLIDTYHRVADMTGRAPVVGGHSKGGQDSAKAADALEGLQKLILVASPRQGPAQLSFRWLMEKYHGSTDLGLDVDHEELSAVMQSGVEVVTVSSDDDWVVRPYEASVPGAKNIRLRKLNGRVKTRLATQRRIYANHLGIFLRAEDVIFRELVTA